jgi:hypothetical protein
MNKEKAARTILISLILLELIPGISFLFVFTRPFNTVQPWVNGFARDGQVESFTLSLFEYFKAFLLPAGAILLGTAGISFIFRRGIQKWIVAFLVGTKIFYFKRAIDIRELMEAIKKLFERDKKYLNIVMALTLLSGINRVVFLSHPISHDEAYTFMAFAIRGLNYAMSNYHLPNNHVFHTILVILSSRLFGEAPWAIRLPAFLAGIALVPATYFVARCFYDMPISLVSTSIVASMPVLIDYSTNARGYTLITLFSLSFVIIAAYVKDHKNLVAWTIFVFVASLGFYTLPIMLYPFGMVMTWLFLSALFKNVSQDYGSRIYLYLIGSGIAVFLLTVLFYAPILISSVGNPLIGNNALEALSWSELIESIPVRIRNTWREWIEGLPAFTIYGIVAGLIVSLFVPKMPRSRKVPLALGGVLWISLALIVQRVAPWPRIWLFLLPFILIWASAGIIGLSRIALNRVSWGNSLGSAILIAFILASMSASLARSARYFSENRGVLGDVEMVSVFLEENLKKDDVVVVTSPNTITLKYYLRRQGIAAEVTELNKLKLFQRAIVVVNRGLGQNLEYVLERRSFLDNVVPESAKLIYESGRFQIFTLAPRN